MVTERVDRATTRGVVWQPRDRHHRRTTSRALDHIQTLAVAGMAVAVTTLALLLLTAVFLPSVG